MSRKVFDNIMKTIVILTFIMLAIDFMLPQNALWSFQPTYRIEMTLWAFYLIWDLNRRGSV